MMEFLWPDSSCLFT